MVRWHHHLNGHEFEQTPADSEGQGSLACCNSWGHKALDSAQQLNNTLENSNVFLFRCSVFYSVSVFLYSSCPFSFCSSQAPSVTALRVLLCLLFSSLLSLPYVSTTLKPYYNIIHLKYSKIFLRNYICVCVYIYMYSFIFLYIKLIQQYF